MGFLFKDGFFLYQVLLSKMTDFDTFFEIQALEDFLIQIDDFITDLDIDEFLQKLDNVCHQWIALNKYNKAIDALEIQFDEILCMTQHPEALTKHDRIQIKKIKQYLNKFHGRSSGYYSIRKKYVDSLIQCYQEMALQNRMVLLANIDLIQQKTEQLIEFYQKEKHNQYTYEPILDDPSLDGLKRHYQCACGTFVQHRCKWQHNRSKKHLEFLKTTFPDQDFPEYHNKWAKVTYTCGCGKNVLYSNKFHHSKSKHHVDWLINEENKLIEEYDNSGRIGW